MSPKAAPKSFKAPVLVIGPWSRGRSYGIVRSSPGPGPDRAQQALLGDFALSLSGWAKRQTGAFVAAFPLPGGVSALVRARHMGEAELGPVAMATVVLADGRLLAAAGGRLHRLLGQVPDPAEAETGLAPLVIDARPDFDVGPIADEGLAWNDQFISVRGDAERCLQALLEGLTPEAQRPRIDGWASTGALPPNGQFDPWALFRLVVHEGAPPPAGSLPSHAIGSVAAGRLSMAPVPPPTAWAAWSALNAAPGAKQAAEAAPWDPSWADTPAADVVAFAAIAACKKLNAPGRVALLTAIAELAEGAEPSLRLGLEGGFVETLGALVRAAEPAAAAGYIRTLGERPAPYTPPIEQGVGSAAADKGVLARLPEAALRRFAGGIVAALAAADWIGEAEDLAALGETAVALLLPEAVRVAASSGDARRLATLMTAAGASAGFSRPRVAEALEALFALPPHADDRLLARPEVMGLVLDRAAPLWPELSARAVRPGMAEATGADAFRRALAAALMAEAKGRAA